MDERPDGIDDIDPETVHSPSTRPTRAKRSRWLHRALRLLSMLAVILPALSYLGLLSPLLSPLVYPDLAPPHWHNSTPHGNVVTMGFAASTDIPGLAFACGSSFTLDWHAPLTFGHTRYWRSHDGGAHWETLNPPFGDQQNCDMAMPPGGNGTILVTTSAGLDKPATLWVSHDAGQRWQRVLTLPAGDTVFDLEAIAYRHGLLYLVGSAGEGVLAVSANDGATWHTVESTPDRLESQGWQVGVIAPDYRHDGWWYRTVTMADHPPMLEHSTDDGATWIPVAPLGTHPLAALDLETTPLRPEHLCAGVISPSTGQITLMGSADGGHTWRTGKTPASLRNALGETSLTVAIGSAGDCYEGFHYGIGRDPREGNSHYGFLCLTSDDATLRYIALADDGNSAGPFTYVPAGNDMGSRLVLPVFISPRGWAGIFSGLAAETSDSPIVWYPVP